MRLSASVGDSTRPQAKCHGFWYEIALQGAGVASDAAAGIRLRSLRMKSRWLWITFLLSSTFFAPHASADFAISAEGVTSTDNYTVWIMGSGFASDSYVDERAPGSNTIIASYRGSARALVNRNGVTGITFRITDPSQQSLLNGSGLDFWVVNPTAHTWVGPVLIRRTTTSSPTLSVTAAGSGSSDSLTAWIVGNGFATNSYVDARPSNGSNIIGSYSGAARTLDSANNANIVTFRVMDSIQQSVMSRVGLNLWVVNPSTGTYAGPKLAIRSSKEQAYGGANYDWYHIDVNGTSCNHEPYGIIVNYNQTAVKSAVRTQLAGMYSEGQRRLRIALFFANDAGTGSTVYAPNGVFPAQYLTNLGAFLADVKAAGFEEVLVGLFPQHAYSFYADTTYSTTKESQYWNLIQQAHQVVVSAGMPYLFDLGNELMPPAGGNPVWATYVTNLWGQYVATYGANYSVGFSTPSSDRLSNMSVYGTTKPSVVDVHIYDTNPATGYTTADHNLTVAGLPNVDIVIGETYYNDTTYAQGIRSAINSSTSGRWARWLTEWPIQRTPPLTCSTGDVPPPLTDENFLLEGF